MDETPDLPDLVGQAAELAGPAPLDAEQLIVQTRAVRRRRAGLQVAASSMAVLVLAGGGALLLAGANGGAAKLAVALPSSSAGPSRMPTPAASSVGARTPTPTATHFPGALDSRSAADHPSSSPTGDPEPSPKAPLHLPAGLDKVCGKPGSTLVVTVLPAVIPHHFCDLRGVRIDVGSFGPLAVPTSFGVGIGVAGSVASLAPGQVLDWSISTDKATGDVTISSDG